MRTGGVDNMSRGGNLLAQDRTYEVIREAGKPLNTREINDRINNLQLHYKGSGRISKTKTTWSVNQIAQILRKSRWFHIVDRVRAGTHSGANNNKKSAVLCVYDVVDYRAKVADLLTKDHLTTIPSKMPKFVQKEWLKQGGVL